MFRVNRPKQREQLYFCREQLYYHHRYIAEWWSLCEMPHQWLVSTFKESGADQSWLDLVFGLTIRPVWSMWNRIGTPCQRTLGCRQFLILEMSPPVLSSLPHDCQHKSSQVSDWLFSVDGCFDLPWGKRKVFCYWQKIKSNCSFSFRSSLANNIS